MPISLVALISRSFMVLDEQRLSRMISTIDTRNGFRFELLPKALSPLFFASDALRNAILAVSAYHRSGAEAALKYKANAVRHLSRSLSTCEASSGIQVASTQLATTMMLCVYSVSDRVRLTTLGFLGLIHRRCLMRAKATGVPTSKAPSQSFTSLLRFAETANSSIPGSCIITS